MPPILLYFSKTNKGVKFSKACFEGKCFLGRIEVGDKLFGQWGNYGGRREEVDTYGEMR